MGGDHRDKRDDRDRKDKDMSRSSKRDRSRSRGRDYSKDRTTSRDKSDKPRRTEDRDRDHKDRRESRHRSRSPRDRDRKEKEKRSDRDRGDRDREKDRDRSDKRDKSDKKEKSEHKDKSDKKEKDKSEKDYDREKEKLRKEQEKKDKARLELDSLFGTKFSVQPAIVTPPPASTFSAPDLVAAVPVAGIQVENADGSTFTVPFEDYFDFTKGVQLTFKPIVITVNGTKIGLPPAAPLFFHNCPSAEAVAAMNAAAINIPVAGGMGGGGLDGTTGALTVNIGQPGVGLLTTDQTRTARENRRMHVTGFPRLTPKELIEQVIEDRFSLYRRELIAKASNIPEEELPTDCDCNVDRIVEIFLDNTKEKPFAFIEINTDDMVDCFISPANINERPINIPLTDGTNASLNFGRPRDFKKLTVVDPTRVLIQGIPPQFDSEKMRILVAKYAGVTLPPPPPEGVVLTPEEEKANKVFDFAMRDGVAFADFEDEESASKVIKGLNGKVLARRLMSAQPLSEVMRAFCINSLGFKIVYKEIPEVFDESSGKKEEDTVFMELLKITSLLPQVMCKLGGYYPHLTPLMGAMMPVYPTRILVLLNIVDDTDLDTEASYSTLCENVANEVEQYGRVKNLIIPRLEPPPPPMFVRKVIEKPASLQAAGSSSAAANPFDAATAAALGIDTRTPEEVIYDDAIKEQDALETAYEKAKREYPTKLAEWQRTKDDDIYGRTGRIYVEYASVQEALNAQQALSGKLYCNRTVVTTFLFEDILYPPVEEQPAAAEPQEEQSIIANLFGRKNNAAFAVGAATSTAAADANDDNVSADPSSAIEEGSPVEQHNEGNNANNAEESEAIPAQDNTADID